MPVNLRLHHAGVNGMKSMFDKKIQDHRTSQLDNPFSEWEGAGLQSRRLSKDDEFYGRPLPGSKSESRAQAAQYHIMMDIKYLCEMIWDCAQWRSKDGRAAITFGKLFNLYNAVSDKVVGTLLRARKHGFVHFDGEILYQRRDDDKVIELMRNINTIRKKFGLPLLPVNGGEPEPWTPDKEEPHILKGDFNQWIPEKKEIKTTATEKRRNSLPIGFPKSLSANHRRCSMPQKQADRKLISGSCTSGDTIRNTLLEDPAEP